MNDVDPLEAPNGTGTPQQRLELTKSAVNDRWGYPVAGFDVAVAGMTDRGLVRSSNEDSFVVLQGTALPGHYLAAAGVFDGVGGQVHGARASSSAAKQLAHLVGDLSLPLVCSPAPKMELEELMQQLNEKLKMDGIHNPALKGMATTATVALLAKGLPTKLWIGHVGDSPAFRLRDGQLRKLIREDSVVCDLVDQGLVAPEDAARHPKRHVITQALGCHTGISPHIAAHAVEPGDCFLLCTDGLTAMVSEDTIMSILEAEPPPTACQELVEAANAAGGIDNVTVVVMRFIH